MTEKRRSGGVRLLHRLSTVSCADVGSGLVEKAQRRGSLNRAGAVVHAGKRWSAVGAAVVSHQQGQLHAAVALLYASVILRVCERKDRAECVLAMSSMRTQSRSDGAARQKRQDETSLKLSERSF